MGTFSRTATLFSTVVLGSMLATTTVSSVNTVVNASETETTQAATTKKNYALKILQGDKDATSTASQFYLDTISLEKQANGNYYAYLTSNTPVNLGDKPISSEDTQHQVVEMGTTEKNGHNQTVYRLTLTADELASGQPIKTKVHVKLDAMDYDHKYDIRLAIQGFEPETAASSSANTSSSSSSVSSASSESSSVTSSEVSSSSVSSSSSIADSSTTTSVAPSSSSQTSSSNSKSSNNDTSASSVVTDDKAKSSDTESSTVDSKDKNDSSTGSTVNITADQGMSRFLKDTAKIDVKGDQTDITLSLKDASAAKMIPSITVADQKKSVSGQETTFTIPTKDLTPDENGKLTLKSLTHVSAQGYTHDYPSNITLDMNPALASTTSDNNNSSSSSSESTATSDKDILKDGTYSINYNVYKSGTTTDSTMKTYMKSPANVTVKNDQATIKFATQNDAMSMMKEFSINGATAKADGDDWVITVPVSELSKTMKSDMTIYVAAIDFTEKPSADIVFDMSSAKKTGGNGSGSSSSQVDSKADITKDGKYSVNYNIYKSGTKTDSTMKTYMKSPAKIAVKDGKATITFATQNDAMSMMKAFSVNGTKAKANGNNWIVTIPVSALSKTMKSDMTVYVSQIDFTEHPSADIVFDMSSVKKTGDNGSGSASSSSSSSSQASSSSASSSSKVSSSQASSSSTPTKPKTDKQIDIHKNGRYVLGYHVYKTGTQTPSTMQQYMTSTAVVDVKNGKATINFKTQKGAMSLMKYFAVNGHKAHAKTNGWQVTLPVSDLLRTLKSNMTIYVPTIHFTEHPSADIVFDVKNAKSTNQGNGIGTDKQISQSTVDQSATANNLGSQNRLGIPNATLHQLTILQGNSNSTSVAAQYFLPTIQLVKNSNGSYTGYVTTHTPTMMGSAPISFMDGTHQVKRVSNIKIGNYYQATYKFSLSANEVKAPINTKIHVHFTAPLNYNHTYTIRLVIGRALNNASEATQPATGLPSMSGDTMTMPLNNSVSRGTFDPAATGTFENNDANAEQQADEMTDKKANKEANSDKKATVKSGTNVAKNAKADQKDNSTQRNVLIIAGGIIAAALGYVGVSLLTNFFKKG